MDDKPKLRIKMFNCGCCAGIEWGGEYPSECRDCGGSGFLFITEHDRIIDYPGGPFRGSRPGKFKELEEQGVKDYDWKPIPTKDELWEMYTGVEYDLDMVKQVLEYYALMPSGTLAAKTLAFLKGVLPMVEEGYNKGMMLLKIPDGPVYCKYKEVK